MAVKNKKTELWLSQYTAAGHSIHSFTPANADCLHQREWVFSAMHYPTGPWYRLTAGQRVSPAVAQSRCTHRHPQIIGTVRQMMVSVSAQPCHPCCSVSCPTPNNQRFMCIDKAIMDCIVVNMLPYSIMEGDAFKRLNFADPAGVRRYHLKSENFFRTSLMPATYDKIASNQNRNHSQICIMPWADLQRP